MTNAPLTSSPPSYPTRAEALPQAWVARIFDRLARQFGTKMADLYAGQDPAAVQAEWAQGLAGYMPAEIERGLAASRQREWAPVLGEFLRLCRPALDAEFAFYEAQRGLMDRDRGLVGLWSHPAVWRAASQMAQDVRSRGFREVRKPWELLLQQEFAAGWGEQVPMPHARLKHQKPRTGPPPDEVREVLRRQRAEFAEDLKKKEGPNQDLGEVIA